MTTYSNSPTAGLATDSELQQGSYRNSQIQQWPSVGQTAVSSMDQGIYGGGGLQLPPQPEQQLQSHPLKQHYTSATPLGSLGRGAAPVDCAACGQRAMTRISYETGETTHIWAGVLCFFLCLGCLPYLLTSFKDISHSCGNCGALLATWHRNGMVEVQQHCRVEMSEEQL